MKEVITKLYAIVPPEKDYLDDFHMVGSLSFTADGAWKKFCPPSLRRKGYEDDGFLAKKVIVTIEST